MLLPHTAWNNNFGIHPLFLLQLALLNVCDPDLR
jgi:hypothetical protein